MKAKLKKKWKIVSEIQRILLLEDKYESNVSISILCDSNGIRDQYDKIEIMITDQQIRKSILQY